jgi:hypothetical protein
MPVEQVNVEYWFRLLYECFHGACGTYTPDFSKFVAFLSHLWLWIVYIGYAVAVIALIWIVYATIRLFELREREEEHYGTILLAPDQEQTNPRWKHIESLRDSKEPNDWRTAIIEADIMLDEMLSDQGYEGEGVGEKLKQIDRTDYAVIDDAWEAHKVRNRIAHDGSAFQLSESLARRTIQRYESVFKEFKVI